MIQTNYIPLEHPYRVVYFNQVLGLQIGSLIMTIETQDATGARIIQTKSHPVVSYCSVDTKKEIKEFSFPGVYAEAVVWDKVEQKDVSTIAAEGGSISWDEFFSGVVPDLWRNYMENRKESCMPSIMKLLSQMEHLGLKIDIPESDEREHRMEVTLYTYEEAGKMRCGSGDGSIISVDCVVDGKNEDEIFNDLFAQAGLYRTFAMFLFNYAKSKKYLVIDFRAGENSALLNRLAERMNKEQEGTALHIPVDVPDEIGS